MYSIVDACVLQMLQKLLKLLQSYLQCHHKVCLLTHQARHDQIHIKLILPSPELMRKVFVAGFTSALNIATKLFDLVFTRSASRPLKPLPKSLQADMSV